MLFWRIYSSFDILRQLLWFQSSQESQNKPSSSTRIGLSHFGQQKGTLFSQLFKSESSLAEQVYLPIYVYEVSYRLCWLCSNQSPLALRATARAVKAATALRSTRKHLVRWMLAHCPGAILPRQDGWKSCLHDLPSHLMLHCPLIRSWPEIEQGKDESLLVVVLTAELWPLLLYLNSIVYSRW